MGNKQSEQYLIINQINECFGKISLCERLLYLEEKWKGRSGMTSAFGYSGMILMHSLNEIASEMPIYFIDTRFHFKETLELIALIKEKWKLDIRTLSTVKSESQINNEIGEKTWEKDPDLCCYVRKVEPLFEVLQTKEIWLHALRKDQAPTRQSLKFAELDANDNLKVYPMVDWTRERCWKHIKDKKIPYNQLHDQSYPSIGCTHCTSPVVDGSNEREGRWNSFPKLECGIHNRQ